MGGREYVKISAEVNVKLMYYDVLVEHQSDVHNSAPHLG